MSEFTTLLDAVSTNTSGEIFTAPEGGEYAVSGYGAFDTCTITVYVSFDEDAGQTTNGFTDSDGTFTSAGGTIVSLPKGAKVWATTTSVGGSTSVSARISRAPVIARS